MFTGYQHDPRLLFVFIALFEEQNVSRAAERLGLSQPALSHALKRLRDEFDDDLFVRAGKGVTPTKQALNLLPKFKHAAAALEELYQREKEVDLSRVEARVVIATTDFFESLLLPKFLPLLQEEAPGIQLVTRMTGGQLPKQEMERGEVDLAVAGFFGELPEGFYQQKLLDEEYVCIARRKHPRLKDGLTKEAFLELSHILVSPNGDLDGAVDKALRKLKLTRRIVAGVSNFHLPASLVASTDCIATIPARMAAQILKMYDLVSYEPPVSVASFTIVQTWHARNHRDPVQAWVRKTIKSLM
jgi:DNA-binding transcriptional LysR family regulator